MTALDVEYKVSLHESKTAGRWNINKDTGTITFNLPIIYDHARKTIDNYRGYGCPDGSPCEELIIKCFIEELIETGLKERVCIERAYQKLKIKGGRCKPFCKVEKPALLMCYPDEWDKVKEWVKH
jgi:hypothetical protein